MTSSLDFEGELILDGVLLDKLETLTKKLQKATKKTDKATILLDAKNEIGENPLFFFLDFILDPQITTGISKAKINKKVRIVDKFPHTFQDICLFLAECNTGSDMALSMAASYIYWNASHKDFLIRVFTKNLPLGVEAATVNKIFGKVVIPVWEVQQGYPIDKVKLKPGTWFSLSRKMNGNRGTFYRGKFISRQGQEFTGLDHIKDDIIKELGDESLIDEYVYDGELVYRNSRGLSDGEAFRIGTGMLNSDGDKSQIKFVVFDLIPTDEFENGKGSLPYEDGSFVTPYKLRRKWLEDLAVTIEQKGLKNIQVVPMVYEGTDQSVIPQWLDYAVKHDWEGLMLNTSVPYKRARHTGCLKIKRFYTVDLRVTAIEEGQNRLAGTMGALVVDYKGNELRVGSGFDDATRATVWANPGDYIGRIIELKYKEVTMDKKTGLESLQFPTFVRFRDDKNEVSYG
jgi:DNA ligase-1